MYMKTPNRIRESIVMYTKTPNRIHETVVMYMKTANRVHESIVIARKVAFSGYEAKGLYSDFVRSADVMMEYDFNRERPRSLLRHL